MFGIKTSLIVVLLSLVMNGAGAAACDTKKNGATQNTEQSKNGGAPTPGRTETNANVPGEEKVLSGEIKTLAEGQYSSITDAFVAVARDAETYAALRETIKGLPDMSADAFKSNVVIAAFIGTRRTGGHTVAITRTGNSVIRIAATSPPKGSMVTQQITAPFKIVSVQIDGEQPPALELDGSWQTMTRPYRVTTGEFTESGGFAGRLEKFQTAGSIGVMRQGKLATFVFDLKSEGGTKTRALKDTATGVVQPDGSIKVNQLGAGTFVEFPRPPLVAQGKFSANEDKLSLTFDSLPTNVSDGFMGTGRLEATATAPPPQRKSSKDEDL